jgi:hypothetical protein
VRRRCSAAFAALAAVFVLVGCATVPDSGPPHAVANRKLEGADLSVNSALVLPPPNGGPIDTVTLLIENARNTQSRDALGGAFFTKAAADAWKRAQGDMWIVRAPRVSLSTPSATTATVKLTGTLVGTVDESGIYQVSRPWQQFDRSLSLVHRDVWRLDSSLPGLLIQESDFESAFQQATLYFPAIDNGSSHTGGSGDVLIPDPRYVARFNTQQQAATSIVGLLLRGPSPWLLPVARRPPKTSLHSNVTTQDSNLVIDFTPEIESAPPADINQFVAQIAWSLPTRPEGAIRLQVNGRDLHVDRVSAVQNAGDWTKYNPHGGVSSTLFYLHKGALKKVVDQIGSPREPTPDTLGGPLARSGVSAAAISLDESAFAMVKGPVGKQILYLGDLRSGTVHQAMSAASIGRPTWGGSQDAVLAPVDGKLYQVDTAGDSVRLDTPPSLGPVRAVRASLDGTRVALIAGDGDAARAFVGLIDRTQDSTDPAIRDLRVLRAPQAKVQDSPLIARIQDIGWSGPTTVTVGGVEADGSPQVRSLTIDGALEPGPARTGLRTGAVTLAVSPLIGAPQVEYVEVAHQLYQGGQRSWSPLTSLSDVQEPFYPG